MCALKGVSASCNICSSLLGNQTEGYDEQQSFSKYFACGQKLLFPTKNITTLNINEITTVEADMYYARAAELPKKREVSQIEFMISSHLENARFSNGK